MLKKLSSLLLIWLSIGPIAAYGEANEGQSPSASKAKQKLSELGVDATVIVKLADGRKLSGRIEEIGDDSLVLRTLVKGDRTAKLTNRVVIPYSEVAQVKYDRPSGGANLGPGFLIAGAVILLIRLLR